MPFLNQEPSIQQEAPEQPWITVFVHGIMSIKPHLNLNNFVLFMRDKIEGTKYEKAVSLMRDNDFFDKNQAMQRIGLHPISLNPEDLTTSSSAMATIFDRVNNTYSVEKQKNYYYTFGWSALMSPSARYYDAKEFFGELQEEAARLEKELGVAPRIRIVGYSHGGNICLNLAAARRDFYPDSTLSINELILLGVPIQTETDYLVTDSLFEKIYNFYSDADRIQPIDFFAFNRVFSQKMFKNRRQLTLPDNLRQINIKLMRIASKDPQRREKIKQLAKQSHEPAILSGTTHLLSEISPGHIELWFFGWAPQHYRELFLFNPLPILAFIPYIIHEIERTNFTFSPVWPIIADMRPELEDMVIKQYNPHSFTEIVPFPNQEYIQDLISIAKKAMPESYTLEEYEEQIQKALKKAAEEHINEQHERYQNKPTRVRNKRRCKDC